MWNSASSGGASTPRRGVSGDGGYRRQCAWRGLSQHPADRLIRELIQTGRAATEDEIERIVERMATAPFDTRIVRVRVAARGVSYRGQTLGARADSLTFHLVKRVALDRQWWTARPPMAT